MQTQRKPTGIEQTEKVNLTKATVKLKAVRDKAKSKGEKPRDCYSDCHLILFLSLILK